MLRAWQDLPENMRTKEVFPYYEALGRHQMSLILKRVFDVIMATILLVVLAIPMVIIAIQIKFDSCGSVFYRQERVTTYGKHFKIHKFRTMVYNADAIGSTVTVDNDVLEGNMRFVGTRPEAVKYVDQYNHYNKAYMATLLLPAGITSEASIRYKDEAELLDNVNDVDKVYMEQVLPGKMKWNLNSIKHFSFISDITTMFRTVFAVLGKDYE